MNLELEAYLEMFEKYLKEKGYGKTTIYNKLIAIKQFLEFLQEQEDDIIKYNLSPTEIILEKIRKEIESINNTLKEIKEVLERKQETTEYQEQEDEKVWDADYDDGYEDENEYDDDNYYEDYEEKPSTDEYIWSV